MLTRSPAVFAAPRREPALGTGISNYSTVTWMTRQAELARAGREGSRGDWRPGTMLAVMTDGRRAATASQRHVAHLQQTNAEERRRRDVTTREGREVVIRGGAKVRSWGRVMK